MSAEENKAIVRRFIEEVFNQRNVDAIDTFMASDYVDHVVPPGVPPTREGFKQFVGVFLSAFPDFHYTITTRSRTGVLARMALQTGSPSDPTSLRAAS